MAASLIFFILVALLPLLHHHIYASESLGHHNTITNTESKICQKTRYPEAGQLRSDQLTVLISGFSLSRLPLLKAIARTYSGAACVHSVNVLWGNNETDPPGAETFESMGAPVFIRRQPSRSLNDRFLPQPYVLTEAVLIADDDVEIDPATICFALRVWTSLGESRRLVGFFPRSHAYDPLARTWIYTVDPDRFSIVLTKLMILPTEFLYIYTCQIPSAVREIVEKSRNCEDIAMNFLAADQALAGPLLVRGAPKDWGDTRNDDVSKNSSVKEVAISGQEGHRAFRGFCIREFHRIWGKMPLRYSFGVVHPDVREQALCRKGGALVACDQEVHSSDPLNDKT